MDINKEYVGKRLKEFAISQFGSVSGLAKALGVSQPSLSGGYISGRSVPGGEMLAKLSDLGCDINWLLKGTEKEKTVLSVFDNSISIHSYPLLSEVRAANFNEEPDKVDIQYTDVTAPFTYYRNGHNCFALRVNGRSMETTLSDGDVVLVDMDLIPVDGDLVAVKLTNGNQYIKRYKNLNFAFIQLSSDNTDYGIRIIDKNDIDAIYPVVAISLNMYNGTRQK